MFFIFVIVSPSIQNVYGVHVHLQNMVLESKYTDWKLFHFADRWINFSSDKLKDNCEVFTAYHTLLKVYLAFVHNIHIIHVLYNKIGKIKNPTVELQYSRCVFPSVLLVLWPPATYKPIRLHEIHIALGYLNPPLPPGYMEPNWKSPFMIFRFSMPLECNIQPFLSKKT